MLTAPPAAAPAGVPPPRFLDRVRWHLRVKRYSIRTEKAYLDWIRRFILFHQKRHPAEMGEEEIASFLSHLAVHGRVAASTQNQALSALLFLYQRVLDRKLEFIDGVERVRRPPKLPVVFTRAEARAVLAHLKGDYRLMAHLLYGSGLRPSSACACASRISILPTARSPCAKARGCANELPSCPSALFRRCRRTSRG